MSFVPTAEDFTLQFNEKSKFQFLEGEDGEIFAYGHAYPETLVKELMLYDLFCDSLQSFEEYFSLVQCVTHTWAVIVDDGIDGEWRFSYGDSYKDTEGSFPLTHILR